MKAVDKILEFILHWISRPLTGRAGYLLIVVGVWITEPPIIIDLVNLVLAKNSLGQLSAVESQPIIGLTLVVLGLFLIVLSHVWIKKHTANEIIGIRHNSLGSFPLEAIKPDLPLIQRLRRYREINVDHSDSYSNGVLTDHRSLIRRLDKVPTEINSFVGSAPDTPISYYGLPHIPAAFYLGYLLADSKYLIQIYELNNNSNRWDQLASVNPSLEIINNKEKLSPSTASGDIILSVGVSYPVQQSEIDELGLENILGHVQFNAKSPQRQLISSHNQIDQTCLEFKATLEHIKNSCPNRDKIHLFYSGPASLCFALGRCISERIDSEIVVYNYSIKEKPKYNWSLTINSSTATSAIFKQHSTTGEANVSVQYA